MDLPSDIFEKPLKNCQEKLLRFAKIFNSKCSVRLNKPLNDWINQIRLNKPSKCSIRLNKVRLNKHLQHRKITAKTEKLFSNLNDSQNLSQLPAWYVSTPIISNRSKFACKYWKVTKSLSFWISTESSFFLDLKFILFYLILIFFSAGAGTVLNLFLNFGQKWASFFM